MITNKRKVTTDGPDYYPTPEWGTKALLKYETFTGNILEPCCGDGAMAEVLKETNCEIFASDIYDRGYGDVCDFFNIKEKYDNIITNPPYNIAENIIEHALAIANVKVCMLVRTAFLESISRYKRFYSKNPPNRVYVFSERLSMYPAGNTITGGGTTSYSWFVWDFTSKNNTTELKWIAPGLKPRIKKKNNI